MNPTLLNECFRLNGRKSWCVEIEDLRRELNRFLAYFKFELSYQGYRMNGRRAVQALRRALGCKELPPYDFVNETQPAEEAADTVKSTA